MKDPRLSNVNTNMTISNEVILMNQFNSEENPFAEYMWMENEEEFNRQVRVNRTSDTPEVMIIHENTPHKHRHTADMSGRKSGQVMSPEEGHPKLFIFRNVHNRGSDVTGWLTF